MYECVIIGLLIVVAGIASIETGVSTAIMELIVGIIAANLLGICNQNVIWLEFLSNFGLLGLMFFAGFEIDREMLKMHFRKSLAIGSSTYLIPFFSILFVSLFLSFGLKSAALISIALSTTSVALVYSLLREKGLLKAETGQVLLTSAMFVDVFSMLSLTVVFVSFDLTVLIYLAILLVFIYLVPKLGRYLFRRYKKNVAELEMRFLLLLLLSMVFFSDRLHISVAVLAFLLGFLLSELLKEHEALVDKLKGIVFGFMAPLFFFNAGLFMKIDLMDYRSLIVMLILGLSAYLSKYLGAFIMTKRYYGIGFSRLSGLLFNYRLTFGTIASIFGLESGLISDGIYAALIMIIMVTSIFSCIMLKTRIREF